MLYAVFSNRGRRAALINFLVTVVALFASIPAFADNLTLAWDASTDPSVAGYKIYYGVASRTYTNSLDVGTNTTVTISNLVEGVTYYFAATTYDTNGLESAFSDEIVYTVPLPVNQPPTLNAPANLTINENAGLQTVTLTGISTGATNQIQTLTVTASSGNTSLIPNPTVTYTSPNATGTLTFTPVANSYGSAVITVTVNNGGNTNNTVTQSFTVFVTATPTISAIANQSTTASVAAGPIPFTISDPQTSASNLVLSATSSNPALVPTNGIVFGGSGANRTVTMTPVTGQTGTASIVLTVSYGSATATSAFQLSVQPVNQPPTLNAPANLTINENAGLQTVTLTGISSGATNQIQTLTVTASSGNTSLIPNPAVTYTSPNATGTLTFTPVANSYGSAVITVTVNNGGNGNSTVSRSFTVFVTATPTISAIANQAVAMSTNTAPIPFTISDSQTSASNLVLSATSSNPALVPTNGIVFGGSGANRTVTVTPITGQTGVVSIVLTVRYGSATATSAFQLSVEAAPPPPADLHVVISGLGTISPQLSSQTLVAGQTYTVTAIPADGQDFAGWSGDVTSSNQTIHFVMTTNFTLQAQFVRSPFAAAQGTFSGLFYEQDTNQALDLVSQASSGAFTLTTTLKSNYSGVVQMGASRYSFRGTLNAEGMATNTLPRRGTNALVLQLSLGVGNQTGQVFGQLTDGNWISQLTGDRAVFNSRTNRAPFAGSYTVVLPGQDGAPSLPAGNGFGTISVSLGGIVKLAGTLADGTKFSQSATLSQAGQWPLYVPLYSGKGSVLSWLTFTNLTNSDLEGQLSWIKPALPHAKYYPGGFANQCLAVGSSFVVPAVSTNQVLDLENGFVFMGGGDLASSFTNSVSYVAKKFVCAGQKDFSLGFTRSSGFFRGEIADPITGKYHSFSGVAFQKQNAGYGLSLGTNQSSAVQLGSD
jgi:hypothetical protein